VTNPASNGVGGHESLPRATSVQSPRPIAEVKSAAVIKGDEPPWLVPAGGFAPLRLLVLLIDGTPDAGSL
jgi:hypothetical protein